MLHGLVHAQRNGNGTYHGEVCCPAAARAVAMSSHLVQMEARGYMDTACSYGYNDSIFLTGPHCVYSIESLPGDLLRKPRALTALVYLDDCNW